MKSPDKETARTVGRVAGAFAIFYGVTVLFLQPSRPTGSWSWILGQIYDVAGNIGVATFLMVIGVFLLIGSIQKKS